MVRSRSGNATRTADQGRFAPTKNGLEAPDVQDEATTALKETRVLHHAPGREVEKSAPKAQGPWELRRMPIP